jgi:peroxiredoxin
LSNFLGYNLDMQTNSPAPDFSLPDVCGRIHRLSDYIGRLVIINFWSAECPWSEKADKYLLSLVERFPGQLVLLTIASNLNEDTDAVQQAAADHGVKPLLIDEECQLANAWEAQTTPHIFMIDQAGILRYQGAVDDVTFRKRIPEQFYVEEALTAILDNRLPAIHETQPYGCTIVRDR